MILQKRFKRAVLWNAGSKQCVSGVHGAPCASAGARLLRKAAPKPCTRTTQRMPESLGLQSIMRCSVRIIITVTRKNSNYLEKYDRNFFDSERRKRGAREPKQKEMTLHISATHSDCRGSFHEVVRFRHLLNLSFLQIWKCLSTLDSLLFCSFIIHPKSAVCKME